SAAAGALAVGPLSAKQPDSPTASTSPPRRVVARPHIGQLRRLRPCLLPATTEPPQERAGSFNQLWGSQLGEALGEEFPARPVARLRQQSADEPPDGLIVAPQPGENFSALEVQGGVPGRADGLLGELLQAPLRLVDFLLLRLVHFGLL